MLLIADSGATKTEWCVQKASAPPFYFITEGYNPFLVDSAYIEQSLRRHLPPGLAAEEVETIFYYGAGCMADRKATVEQALGGIFSQADLHVEVDLLGAARALLGTTPGFAA